MEARRAYENENLYMSLDVLPEIKLVKNDSFSVLMPDSVDIYSGFNPLKCMSLPQFIAEDRYLKSFEAIKY